MPQIFSVDLFPNTKTNTMDERNLNEAPQDLREARPSGAIRAAISEGECDCNCEAEAPMMENPTKQIKDIKIKALDYGFIVNVGCQSFAIETPTKLLTSLSEHFKDPAQTERDWFAGKFLKD